MKILIGTVVINLEGQIQVGCPGIVQGWEGDHLPMDPMWCLCQQEKKLGKV